MSNDSSLTIINAYSCDAFGHPKFSFSKGTSAHFNVTVFSTLFGPQNIKVTLTVYDEQNVPIGLSYQTDIIFSNSQKSFFFCISIPKWAFVGLATAHVNSQTEDGTYSLEHNVVFYILGERTSTSITVGCAPMTVDKMDTMTTRINGKLTTDGSGLSAKTVKLYYQYASSQYGIPAGSWIPLCDVTTDEMGYYKYFWDPPTGLQNGYYWIGAEFEGDSTYSECYSYTGTSPTPNLLVVPQVPYGTIMVLAASFLALLVCKRNAHKQKKAGHSN